MIKKELEALAKRSEKIVKDPEKADKLLDRALKKLKKHKIPADASDASALFRMAKAWVKKDYKKIPWKTAMLAIGTAIYLLNPLDAVPDFLPLLGLSDDFTLIAFVLRSMKKDIDEFKKWEATSGRPESHV